MEDALLKQLKLKWQALSHENCSEEFVLGDLNPGATYLCVGEALGEEEQKNLKPFVGSAGLRLKSSLIKAGIERTDVSFANIIPRRPLDAQGQNRTPDEKEIKANAPFLFELIHLVQPKVVLLLGNVPLTAFTGRGKISEERGMELVLEEFPGILFVPTYHPANTLYKPSNLNDFEKDLKWAVRLHIGDVVDLKKTSPFPYVKTAEEFRMLQQEWKTLPFLYVDLEAGAEPPAQAIWHWDSRLQIILVSLGWISQEHYFGLLALKDRPFLDRLREVSRACIVEWNEETIPLLKELLESGIPIVGQNIYQYDIPVLEYKGIQMTKIKGDTYLIARILDENEWGGLKSRLRHTFGFINHTPYRTKTEERHWQEQWYLWPTMTVEEREERIHYSGLDAWGGVQDWIVLERQFLSKPNEQRLYHNILVPACTATIEMERTGLPVNVKRLWQMALGLTRTIRVTTQAIRDKLPENAWETVQPPKKKKDIPSNKFINPGSTKQLAKILFSIYGLPAVRFTEKGDESTNIDALLKLLSMKGDQRFDPKVFDIIELMLTFREKRQILNMFVTPIMNQIKASETREWRTTGTACVPFSTLILTKRGWLNYNEVKIGDQTLGYKDGKLHWTKVKNVFIYDKAQIIKIHTDKQFSLECTPDHRWLISHPVGRNYHDRKTELTAKHITSNSWIILSAPFVGGTSEITPDEAKIIAWLYTDGSIYKGKINGLRGTIFQSKPHQDLKRILEKINYSEYKTIKQTKGHQFKHAYYIPSDYMKYLWGKAGLWARSLSELVLELSSDSRKAFLDAGLQAEGNKKKYGSHRFFQNTGEVLEAFRLAAYLNGHFVREHDNDAGGHSPNNKCLSFGKPIVTGRRLKRHKNGIRSVWCVETGLGTWTAFQGKHIFLTGNSLHGRFHVAGTDTLRLSSSDPNLQNWPKEMRKIVEAPPGYVIVHADYNSLEVRGAADLSRDGTLVTLLRQGEDMHFFNTKGFMGYPPETQRKDDPKYEQIRYTIKTAFFASLYGARENKIADILRKKLRSEGVGVDAVREMLAEKKIDPGEEDPFFKLAEAWRLWMFAKYPGLKRWHSEVRRKLMRDGEIQSWFKYTRHLPDAKSDDQKAREEAIRIGINFVPQSLSMLTLIALRDLKKIRDETHEKDWLALAQVHDSIDLLCKEEAAGTWAELLKLVMEDDNVWREFDSKFLVPLVAEVKIVKTWG